MTEETQEIVQNQNSVQDQQEDVELITFGCRLNIYESEVMKTHARNAGLKNTIIVY